DAPAALGRRDDRLRHHAQPHPPLHRPRNPGRPAMGSGSSLSSDVRLNSSLPDHLRRKHQDPALIRRVLRETRTIAIVGLSPNAQKASHFVGRYLQHHGYRIVPVYPRPVDILGEPSYPTLLDIPDELAAQI